MPENALAHVLPIHQQLEQLFADCFFDRYQTRLEGGAHEPFYQAPRQGKAAVVFYRADYVASALHEVAHWCIAGKGRRQQDDYGYWYAADGRNLLQQQEFERVETKPQALELLFSRAIGLPFRVSVDNLALPDYDTSDFAQNVEACAADWQRVGLPERVACFLEALSVTGSQHERFVQVGLG